MAHKKVGIYFQKDQIEEEINLNLKRSTPEKSTGLGIVSRVSNNKDVSPGDYDKKITNPNEAECSHFPNKDNEIDLLHSQSGAKIEEMLQADLIAKERLSNTKRLWKRALAVGYFIGVMQSLRLRVKNFGALRKQEHYNNFLRKTAILPKTRRYIPIYPEDSLKLFWDFLISIMLILIGLIIPYRVSFIDEGDQDNWIPFDYVCDVMFAIDIFVNFLTAYYNEKNELEKRYKKIARNYVCGWFIIDDFSTNGSILNKLLRILRLPRLYRLIKIFRIAKTEHTIKNTVLFNHVLMSLHLNLGVARLLKVLLHFFFLCHIISCFWYYTARFDEFGPDTWVVRYNLLDAEDISKYLAAFEWVFQTLTTVGFGDIAAQTLTERIFAIMWMIIGVGFYSFAIGNVGTILANMDRRLSELKNKMNIFNDFSLKVHLPTKLKEKVLRFFETNHTYNSYCWTDPNNFLQELPSNIKREVLLISYAEQLERINIFHIDANFTSSILPYLTIMTVLEWEIIYREGDVSEEVFFLSSGKVQYRRIDGVAFLNIEEGAIFGEIEAMDGRNRDCFAEANESSLVLVCKKEDFQNLLKEFPLIEDKIKLDIRKKKEKIAISRSNKLREPETVNRTGTLAFWGFGTKKKREPLLKSTAYFLNLLDEENETNQKIGFIDQLVAYFRSCLNKSSPNADQFKGNRKTASRFTSFFKRKPRVVPTVLSPPPKDSNNEENIKTPKINITKPNIEEIRSQTSNPPEPSKIKDVSPKKPLKKSKSEAGENEQKNYRSLKVSNKDIQRILESFEDIKKNEETISMQNIEISGLISEMKIKFSEIEKNQKLIEDLLKVEVGKKGEGESETSEIES